MADKRCHYCERALAGLGSSRDHIVPVSMGAGYMPRDLARGNIVMACRDCNSRKGSALLPEHCDLCRAAHRVFLAWLPEFERINPAAASLLGGRYALGVVMGVGKLVGEVRQREMRRIKDKARVDANQFVEPGEVLGYWRSMN